MTPQEHKERAEEYMERYAILVSAGAPSDSARDELAAAQVHANLANVPEVKTQDTTESERRQDRQR